VFANVTAAAESDPDTIRGLLVDQVTGMVRWRESIGNMVQAGVEEFVEIAKEMGAKRAVPLPVSAPFHCPLMQPAAEAMRDALSYVVVERPTVPVFANVTAQPESDPDTIRNLLVEQVTGMVRWRESIGNMVDAGVEEFVELGGKVLGPMVKRIAPDAKVTSVVSIEDVEALAKSL
jgi:[acyl-carrier-protein] S-malonyltransferase